MSLIVAEAPKGVTKDQKSYVEEAFKLNLDAMAALKPRYDALTEEKLVNPTKEQMEEARKVRLLLVKTRTGTANTHKTVKADALAYGKFVDSIKNTQKALCSSWEEALLEIEEHEKRIEAEKVRKVVSRRNTELSMNGLPLDPPGIESMNPEEWKDYVKSQKLLKEAKDKEEREERDRQKNLEEENRALKQREADRLQKEQRERMEKEQADRLKKDEAHRAIVHQSIMDEMGNHGIDCETATKIIDLVSDGKIPHLTIQY